MIKSAESTAKTVHLNDSKKYYTKVDNDTIRTHIEGDPLTAKDIWLDALSCQDDWLFTTENIARRHNISEKKAQRLCTRLVKHGVAERCKIIDSKTGQFIMQHYIFYESPLDKKCPEDEKQLIVKKSNRKDRKNREPSGQKVSSGSIKNKQHKNKQQSGPPPESPPPDIPKLDPAAKERAIADGIKKIRKILDRDPFANKQLSRSFLTNAIARHGLPYLLLLAEDCLGEKIPYMYFSKGVHKENGYEKQNRKVSRNAEAQAIKEQQEHAKDIDAIINDTPDRQSLTKPSSDQDQPINPKKNMALEDEKLRYRPIENLNHEPDDAFQQRLLKAGILKDMNQIEPES